MFRFADTDMRAILADVKPIDELIQKTLRASVPGLITGEALNPLDEAFSANGRHRNLIPPHAFNVTTLFQPTIAFIERAASMAPAGFEEEPKAYGAVLEDFVVRVFLPQLDERVTASFQNAVSGYDAYQLDLGVKDTDKPPLKVSLPDDHTDPSRASG
jgi:exocyst complex component 4